MSATFRRSNRPGRRPAERPAPAAAASQADFQKMAAALETHPVTQRHLRGDHAGERDRYVRAYLGAFLAHAGLVAQGTFARSTLSPRAALAPYRRALCAAYRCSNAQLTALIRTAESVWDGAVKAAVESLRTTPPSARELGAAGRKRAKTRPARAR